MAARVMPGIYRDVRIKEGAVVSVDRFQYRWPSVGANGLQIDVATEFTARSEDGYRFRLVTRGFGLLNEGSGAYGDGAVHAYARDLIFPVKP
jgi:hypothetical protein